MKLLVIIRKNIELFNERDIIRNEEYDSRFSDLIVRLENNNIDYHLIKLSECALENIDMSSYDVVLVFGGDGTLLHAQQYIIDKPVLPIRADSMSRGYLMNKDLNLLDDISSLKQKLVTRALYVEQNQLALNEIYVGSLYAMGNAHLEINGHRIHSSGIIISTGAGSSAWYSSMGGKKFDMCSEELRYLIREPTPSSIQTTNALLEGVIKKNEELRITVLGGQSVVISLDGETPDHLCSRRLHNLQTGQEVTVRLGAPLRLLC